MSIKLCISNAFKVGLTLYKKITQLLRDFKETKQEIKKDTLLFKICLQSILITYICKFILKKKIMEKLKENNL